MAVTTIARPEIIIVTVATALAFRLPVFIGPTLRLTPPDLIGTAQQPELLVPRPFTKARQATVGISIGTATALVANRHQFS